MITLILEGILDFLSWIFDTGKKLWQTDKFVSIYLVLAIVVGKTYEVKLELYWLAVLALLGVFGFYSHYAKQQYLGIFADYLTIFGFLSNQDRNKQVTGTIPEYISPPRADININPKRVNPIKQKLNVIDRRKPEQTVKAEISKEDINFLEEILKENILSQEQAVECVVKGIKRKAAGTEANKNAPLTFLLTGPTGTGKTQLVKLVADSLNRPFDRYDMGNYKNESTLWQMLGSPQGYVGDAGKLTQFVKSKPNAVLLFDEIEKGCNQMYDFMLPLIDEGIVKDNKTNETIKFSDTLVFFTTNLITEVPEEARENVEIIRDDILAKGFLRQELVARIRNIVPFYGFSDEDIVTIVEKQISDYLDGICKSKQYDAEYSCSYDVIDFISRSVDKKYGARNVSQQIEKYVGNEFTDILFSWGTKPVSKIKLALAGKKISVELE